VDPVEVGLGDQLRAVTAAFLIGLGNENAILDLAGDAKPHMGEVRGAGLANLPDLTIEGLDDLGGERTGGRVEKAGGHL